MPGGRKEVSPVVYDLSGAFVAVGDAAGHIIAPAGLRQRPASDFGAAEFVVDAVYESAVFRKGHHVEAPLRPTGLGHAVDPEDVARVSRAQTGVVEGGDDPG